MNNIIRPEAWWGNQQPPLPPGPPEPPRMDLLDRVSKIEASLPTLATREDLLLTKGDLTQQMHELRHELRGEMHGLRGETHELRGEMHKEFNLQTWRIVGAIIAAGGLLVAGLRLIP